MLRRPSATSVSSVVRSPSIPPPRPDLRRAPDQPATMAAQLDLTKPGERQAHDLVRRFCTGRWPLWRLIGMRREGLTLFVAIEWLRGHADRFALAEVALAQVAVRWRSCASSASARAALDHVEVAPSAKAVA